MVLNQIGPPWFRVSHRALFLASYCSPCTLVTNIESEIRLFADDCVCYREINYKEDTLKLQMDIDRSGN